MLAQPQLRKSKSQKNVIKDATIREFGGGWNVVDNELNLSTKYATLLDNMTREEDGSMGVRWGTSILADISDADWLNPAYINLVDLTHIHQRHSMMVYRL